MVAAKELRSNRAALFDGIEEGGIRASSSYGSHEIDEHDNERAMEGLQDRVILLKRLSGDIHEEVETHNRVLDRMGNDMDSSRGVLSGTMDRFKMVFETKSSRRMFTLVASFVVIFLVIYYLTSSKPTKRVPKLADLGLGNLFNAVKKRVCNGIGENASRDFEGTSVFYGNFCVLKKEGRQHCCSRLVVAFQ
ncbi:hypothetical protein TIFTF001_018118 [Ficus carica]|uniref:t-SNARE coiled-coil homology domain-containing protein n=1 Tax=Ficus carica TaxID=3494 RepID=A0AA88ARM1_FICCA|nr:hypothetical protein TIFTF001_018118 [Ficus carica]